jgi:isocitrate dehydrogenase
LDDTPALAQFAKYLEEACVECIDEDGVMTKDLALAMKGKNMGRGDWVTTDEYMKAVNVSLIMKGGRGKKLMSCRRNYRRKWRLLNLAKKV